MKNKNIVMKKTYFEPEMRIVKLHSRPLLVGASQTHSISSSRTNLGNDGFEYVGGGDDEGR